VVLRYLHARRAGQNQGCATAAKAGAVRLQDHGEDGAMVRYEMTLDDAWAAAVLVTGGCALVGMLIGLSPLLIEQWFDKPSWEMLLLTVGGVLTLSQLALLVPLLVVGAVVGSWRWLRRLGISDGCSGVG
jgi:hypothetical protein